MNIEAILKEAVSVVDGAEVPDQLRTIAFEQVLGALLMGGRARSTDSGEGEAGGGANEEKTDGGVIEQIAGTCGLDIERAKQVFAEDPEGGLELVIPVGRLESSKASATKQIALLVAGGRFAGGLGEWTNATKIRSVCERFGKFDTANFAATVRKMQDVFSFRGSRQRRQVRINLVGMEQMKVLLEELATGQTE